MDTTRISKTIEKALNAQMTKEAHAAQVYLSYAAWAADKGFDGVANFLFRHSAEERNHMMKIVEYILQRNGKVVVTAIPAPDGDPTSLNNCFEKVFNSEIENTKEIYSIVNMSMEEKDWATWNFMQWFVKEQIEEETLALNLMSKIKIAGGEKASGDALYNLDRDLGKTPDDASSAEDATTANP